MINSIINELNGKNVCILGFGTEGKSTYHFIRRYSDMKLTIRDKKDVIEANSYLSDDNNIEVICGEDYLKGLEEYDLVISKKVSQGKYKEGDYAFFYLDNPQDAVFINSLLICFLEI